MIQQLSKEERWEELLNDCMRPVGGIVQDLEYLLQLPSINAQDFKHIKALRREIEQARKKIHKVYEPFLRYCARKDRKENDNIN